MAIRMVTVFWNTNLTLQEVLFTRHGRTPTMRSFMREEIRP